MTVVSGKIVSLISEDPEMLGFVMVDRDMDEYIEMRLYPPDYEETHPRYGIALIKRGDEKAAADFIKSYTEKCGGPPSKVTFSDPMKIRAENEHFARVNGMPWPPAPYVYEPYRGRVAWMT